MKEYVSKDDLLNATVRRNSIWNLITNSEGKNLEEIINELTVADVCENVYGHWIKMRRNYYRSTYQCSQCNHWHKVPVDRCPHCFAIMNKKGTDADV